MAPVYLAKELPINEHPHERQTLCIGAFGPEEDFFTVKGALEALAEGFDLTLTYQRETTSWLHPGISAAVYCNGKRLGVFEMCIRDSSRAGRCAPLRRFERRTACERAGRKPGGTAEL